jgi:hypothetical protein
MPVPGKDVTLTIDIVLQEYAEKLLKGKRGSIVAIEPETGEILAIVSAPFYDANSLTGTRRGIVYDSLNTHPWKPLYNRALRGTYRPRLLLEGNVVELDTYTFNRSAMTSARIKIPPAPWLIVEGLFALYNADVRNLIDITAFIDASVETRLERRKHRDLTVRGYTPEEVQYQWDNHVRPSDIKFIEPWKSKCDVVIDNENNWELGLMKLIEIMELEK